MLGEYFLGWTACAASGVPRLADLFRDGVGRQGPVTQHVGNAELRRCIDGPRENPPVIMSRTAIGAGTSF
jgi:hypothetical protein